MKFTVLPVIENYDEALTIRWEVFQKEQGIDEKIDFDGEDENAIHFIAYNEDNEPVGTARVRFFDQGKTAKVERLAVLKEYRGSGAGATIMNAIDEYLEERKVTKAYMNAQKSVESFHAKFGFKPEGEDFIEAGIPHVKMVKWY
jgi:cystathionine beta-lyase